MENSKKRLKGFTLIELIIVLAIFGVILTLVMSFIDPVSKLMSNTSVKERTAAYVDNITEYLDQSIHYAKFAQVYDGGYFAPGTPAVDSYSSLATDADKEKAVVKAFVEKYFNGAVDHQAHPITGKVRVLKLINSEQNFDGTKLVPGRVYESAYTFTAGDTYPGLTAEQKAEINKNTVVLADRDATVALDAKRTNVQVVNPEHFENYNYYYKLGYYDMKPVDRATLGSHTNKKTTKAVVAPKTANAYYNYLVPTKDRSNSDISGKIEMTNFPINVVAYTNVGDSKIDTSFKVDESTTVDRTLFLSPAHMSTVSMALINAIKAEDAHSVAYYRVKYKNDGSPEISSEGAKVFEAIGSTDYGAAFYYGKASYTGATDNIYIVFVLPDEIDDTAVKLT